MKDLLRNVGESVLNPQKREREVKETAIAAWENDPDRKARQLKVVRGADGLPVEIVMKSNIEAAFVVNGQEEPPFAVARLLGFSSFNDPIPSLCLKGELKEGYIVKATVRIDYGKKGKHLYVLTGVPTGTPPGLVETLRS
jgi:hypothetical protein